MVPDSKFNKTFSDYASIKRARHSRQKPVVDSFFSKTNCDRCGTTLAGKTRIMSMYNNDCLCLDCKQKETERPDYKTASDADVNEIKKGNYNFPGIGLKKEE
jgi:hypothetical protein